MGFEKRQFDDGCIGFRMKARDIDKVAKHIFDALALTDEQMEDLMLMLNTQNENYVPFYDIGYEVGWKYTSTRDTLAIVICPIEGGK